MASCNVIYLDDFVGDEVKMERAIRTRKKAWTNGLPVKPPLISDDSLFIIRNKLGKIILNQGIDKLFMPIASDLEPFWTGCAKQGWFNNEFTPYVVTMTVIRDYPQEFYMFVDGFIVGGIKKYNKLLADFNKLYMSALAGKGNGEPKGTLNVDEFIRLGALFYCLFQTADTTFGIQTNSLGYVTNEWCGEKRVITLNKPTFLEKSSRLQESFFAGLDPEGFFYRAVPETDESTMWLINFASLDLLTQDEGVLNIESLIQTLDKVGPIKNRGGKLIVVLPNEEIVIDLLKEFYSFRKREDKPLYSNVAGYHVYTNRLGPRYIMLTNFQV